MKIKVFTAYYGKLPLYFNAWVKTCANNPWIDFCIITDQDIYDLPQNVIAVKMDWKELKERFQFVLGFEISLDRPYE